ncbi:hypothetical protein O9G_000568 [Rozella allomycis CSF55]|uniref:Dynein regulatory complex protein 10 n=1 Tax=Rozella allomycis (strain CSF55) TaxID=988480 RepID=A0A075B0N6_ROZAC|nr:hypothetical protein O9G_000568 [Rozella allomycis CSF55]|eukprot:EPZ34381.1 hypothetical protein O9G_000568 [Rozella allomycis CSF55]
MLTESTSEIDIQESEVEKIMANHKAQSFIAILEDAIDQLAILDDLIPENDHNRSQERILGNEINRIMKERHELEYRYQSLAKDQPTLKTKTNKFLYKENQQMLNNLSNEYAQSTQVLARTLKSHPAISQNIKKIQIERGNVQTLIFKTMRELKEGRYNHIAKYLDEEHNRRNALQNTIEREKKAVQILRKLKEELNLEKTNYDNELHERNQVIQHLRDTIQEITVLTNAEQKYTRKEMKAREASFKQQYSEKESSLIDERQQLQKQIELEEKAHERIVEFLNQQKDDLENQIQIWMTKHEEDTEKKSMELESLKTQRAQDLEKFEQLVNTYEEYEKFVEEYKIQKKKEEEMRKVMEEQTRAALVLQRWYRKRLQKAKSSAKTKKKKSAKKKK